jgi:hypothetical protein
LLIGELDEAEVRELAHCHARNVGQSLLGIECGGEYGTNFGKELFFMLDSLAFRDVPENNCEQPRPPDIQL